MATWMELSLYIIWRSIKKLLFFYVDNTTNEMAAMRILIYKLLSENETNAFFSENSTLLKPKLYRNYHLNEI
jgi:hypothetical protein